MIYLLIAIVILLYLSGAYIMLAFLRDNKCAYGWFEIAFWFVVAALSTIEVSIHLVKKKFRK